MNPVGGHDSRTLFPRDRVAILGVLNVTPDSFSDGGRFVRDEAAPVDVAGALAAAKDLVARGADWVDVGGESTRPGALEVPEALERERTLPVVEALANALEAPISIDTRKAGIARAALAAGARIVNDVSGLQHDAALADAAGEGGALLIVGHMRGTPETMQRAPHYEDVLGEVARELEASLALARRAGLPDAQLAADPGLGFGKRVEDNLALLGAGGWLGDRLGVPIVLGPSRKSFLAALAGDPAADLDAATADACAVAAFAGADALRVHEPAGAARAAHIARAARQASAAAAGGAA